ncbi:PREDICTED: uncharacterized protein LOC104818287 [Tarenaya hassleriana]|uniref:uncharacterized protein LOC104818287 n=1 Tax=Tarenaya hassleriana TaxID=28532 RepID=UPI00053C2262|nr:PREDICTED: uncharacterized protein LOC104818287 [Tarenaya hassleriana]
MSISRKKAGNRFVISERMMGCLGRYLIFSLGLLLVAAGISPGHGKKIKSAVFLSPKLVLSPGSVVNEYYHNIDFPRGHIGLKRFDAEVVDEAGNPVPLHETYLHHWIIQPYYARKGVELSEQDLRKNLGFSGQDSHRNLESGSEPDFILVKNGGLCRNTLRHYFGLGSETRKTSTHVPDPYGIEIGNPEEIPDGYEFRWLLNTHAIDTRGVEDRLGCTECRCDLYNITVDEYGRPITSDYKGGLLCCYDKTQCRVRKGFDNGRTRTLYLKYTVTWVDWDSSVLPVTIYILDITDSWKKTKGSTGINDEHNCHVEYDVKPCKSNCAGDDDVSLDVERKSLAMPFNGYIVYGVCHQHAGGRGAALYREDGGLICSSTPTYGKGVEPGNEAGYIVGMSTCYPEPVKVTKGETLVFESNYSSAIGHTGVMGLFYIMVAQQLPDHGNSFPALIRGNLKTVNLSGLVAVAGVVALVVIAAVVYRRQNRQQDGYEPLST